MESFDRHDDEYEIIWYRPDLYCKESVEMRDKKLIYLFSGFEGALKFSQSLKMSFLVILPNELLNEEELLKEFKSSNDSFCRRLTNFEEEAVLTGLLEKFNRKRSPKIYSFFNREDFESEALENEEMKNQMTESGVKEAAFSFRQEYEYWERHKEKLDYHPKTMKLPPKVIDEEDFQRCKEFCIKSLKEIARKRKKEKIRVIYYMNLAESCQSLGESQRAIEYSEKVFEILRFIYGEEHALTASSYRKLAYAYYQVGNYQRALEYNEKALIIREAVYGEENHFTPALYQSVGWCCLKLGESQKAIENMVKAVDIGRSLNGETHWENLKLIEDLAEMYMSLEEYEKALEHLMKVFEITVSVYGEKCIETQIAVSGVAITYDILKQYGKSLEYFFKYLEITKAIFGEIHRETQDAYLYIANRYADLQEEEKYLEYLEKFLYVKVSLQGEMNAEIADDYQELAEGYENLEKYQEAFLYYLKTIEIKRVINGEDHQDTEEAYESLEVVYGNLEKSQKELIENNKYFRKRFDELANGKLMEEDDGNLENNEGNPSVNCDSTIQKISEEEGSTEVIKEVPMRNSKEDDLLGKRAPFHGDEDEEFEQDIEKKVK